MIKKKIIIFGAGYHGRDALRACKAKKNFYDILCFVDNNKKIQNKKILGIKVFSPERIKKIEFDYIILSGRCIKEINLQLEKIKVKKNKIKLWGKKELRISQKLLKRRSKDYDLILKTVIKKLELNKINFWLDLSGLLSLMRGQDFAEMSDVEIAINYNDLKKIIHIFHKGNINFLYKKRIIYRSKLLKKKIPQVCLFGKNTKNDYEPAIIEFNILIFKEDIVENVAKQKFFKNEIWEYKIFKKYKNLKIPAPSLFKQYLSKLYGKDWRIKKNFYYK